ncbi:MAG TPA: hypothetical protein VG498_10085 [Terriglobales bacterium]|nr:hypothetical protein [Terriglobales bacterium]
MSIPEGFRRFFVLCLVVLVTAFAEAVAGPREYANSNVEQVARILGVSNLLGDLRAIGARIACKLGLLLPDQLL